MSLPRAVFPVVLTLLALAVPAAAYGAHLDAPGAADEPLASAEWWRSVVGADAAAPPGPGKPVTVVDSGLDITHEEFRSRPNTTLLNTQTLFGAEDDHGTEVASVVGAPVNHIGLVGVYPQAVLRSWDASPFGAISASAAAQGIVAAANAGPGVINISFGGMRDDPLVRDAVLYAFRRGSLVVASSGNDGLNGNPLGYPASYPHVLTVAATDQTGIAAVFSSRSPYVDLAAPGSRIPVAEPVTDDPKGYIRASGTSFAAPMVSGAAAWVWTVRLDLDNTQLFEVMRMSARDVDPSGDDRATGFGVLDIPAALAFAAPPPDPLEPNDDVNEVSPTGLFTGGQPAITSANRRSATVIARVDRYEDPHDVYRVFVPAHGSVTAQTGGGAVDLRLYAAGTQSIAARPSAVSAHRGSGAEAATIRNRKARGAYAYVEVRPDAMTARASYTLRITTAARR